MYCLMLVEVMAVKSSEIWSSQNRTTSLYTAFRADSMICCRVSSSCNSYQEYMHHAVYFDTLLHAAESQASIFPK